MRPVFHFLFEFFQLRLEFIHAEIDRLLPLLRGARAVVLTTHVNPDGDGLGASLDAFYGAWSDFAARPSASGVQGAVQEAGAFAVVLECIPLDLAAEITAGSPYAAAAEGRTLIVADPTGAALPAGLAAGCELVTTGALDAPSSAEGSVQLQLLAAPPADADKDWVVLVKRRAVAMVASLLVLMTLLLTVGTTRSKCSRPTV